MADEPKVADRIVELVRVPAGELVPHPQNWRVHPETQKAALEAAIQTIGVADAVLAYRSERHGGQLTLIDGHLRHELLDEVPVLVLDLTDDEADVLLASHDVLTTMAYRDEAQLGELLRGVEMAIPRDLMLAIDPDLTGEEMEDLIAGTETNGGDGKYPIIAEYDEGFDSLIVFATREADWAWLEKEFDLPTMIDRKTIGISHVLTVQQFRELWEKKLGA